MNYLYPIPGGQTAPAVFVASPTLILGTYVKALDARTMITVDYTQLSPAVSVQAYSFKVSHGGEPQLWIDGVALNSNILTFYLSGGMSGQAYEVRIIAKLPGERREDLLSVQMLEDGGDCCAKLPWPTVPPGSVTGDGGVFINTCPTFYVSGTEPVDPQVLDRWYQTSTGNIYDYVTNGVNDWWALATTGGNGTIGAVSSIIQLDPIAPDGTTTVFTVTAGATDVDIVGDPTLFVSVNGVWQQPTTDYSASDDQLTFTTAPEADALVFMLWFQPPTPIVKIDPITPDGARTEFDLTVSGIRTAVNGATTLFVSVDGVWQQPGTAYVANGSSISFMEAPPADSVVFMVWFTPESDVVTEAPLDGNLYGRQNAGWTVIPPDIDPGP